MLQRSFFSAIVLVASALLPAQSDASSRPMLRADVVVSDELVRIGDLVSDAGALADIAVFRAPDFGHTGSVEATRVLDAVRRHGLMLVETRGVSAVSVTRMGVHLGAKDIEAKVVAAIAASARIADPASIDVTFEREVRALTLDPAASTFKPVRVSFDQRSSRFDVIFDIGTIEGVSKQRVRYTGIAVETVNVAVLTRSFSRGETIGEDDVVIERRPKAAVPSGSVDRAAQIVGLAAKRALSAAQTVRASDLMRPELVRQNEIVTVIYETPGINLTMRAKALESGSHGDTVNVTNLQSKRTMQGIVSGPRRVTIVTALPADESSNGRANSIAAAAPQQRAE